MSNSTYGVNYFRLKLEIFHFLIKTLLNNYGVSTSSSEYSVGFTIVDEEGNYEILTFKKGNTYAK